MTGDNRPTGAARKPKLIIALKATKLHFVVALSTSLAALSFAGPGPDYRARIRQSEKQPTEAKAKTDVQAKVQAASQVASGTACGCPAMKKP